jgi:ADP-ribosylglycohydrolase
VREKLVLVGNLLREGASAADAAAQLGTSTLAVESVPAALWFFLARHETFTESIAPAALFGGDVDSIYCLVGALRALYMALPVSTRNG